MPGQPFLTGERVTLRTIERGDVDTVRRWLDHPEVRRYLHDVRLPHTREEYEQRFREGRTDADRPDLLICVGGEPVGRVRLVPFREHRRSANLGFLVAPVHRGNGYATAAAGLLVEYGFAELLLHRIEAKALAPNEGSRRVLEKLGFVEEGRRRGAAVADGEFVDEVVYGRLRPEWEG